MDVMTIYAGNDALVEVKGLLDRGTGEFVNDASVTMTLLDAAGAEVAGQIWPLGLAYIAGTDAVYRATLLATLPVTPGARYTAVIDADGGLGLLAKWEIDVVCRKRRR
jgi:hypothetical protein